MECEDCPDKCNRTSNVCGCENYINAGVWKAGPKPKKQCPIKKLISKITVESIIVDTYVVIFVILWIFVLKEFINILQMI